MFDALNNIVSPAKLTDAANKQARLSRWPRPLRNQAGSLPWRTSRRLAETLHPTMHSSTTATTKLPRERNWSMSSTSSAAEHNRIEANKPLFNQARLQPRTSSQQRGANKSHRQHPPTKPRTTSTAEAEQHTSPACCKKEPPPSTPPRMATRLGHRTELARKTSPRLITDLTSRAPLGEQASPSTYPSALGPYVSPADSPKSQQSKRQRSPSTKPVVMRGTSALCQSA